MNTHKIQDMFQMCEQADQMRSQIWTLLLDQMHDQVAPQTFNKVWDQTKNEVYEKVDDVKNKIRSAMYGLVR